MRKLMIAVATVAGLALTGCQQNKNDKVAEKRQELTEAQRDASKKSADVRQDLNEKVAEDQRDAQKDLANANEDVSEKQQDLAKAQREAQEDRMKDGAAMAAAATVEGRVQSADNDKLVLSVPAQANGQLSLKLDDKTRVLQNNREVKLDDIPEGSQVRASYVTDGNDKVARDVTVIAPLNK